MKTKEGVGIAVMAGFMALTVFWAAAQVVSLGQSSKPQTVPIEKLPVTGTFLSMQNYPPLPMNPFTELLVKWPQNLPVYQVESGVFLIDDRALDRKALALAAQVLQLDADLKAVEAGEMTLQSLLEGESGGSMMMVMVTNCGTGEPLTLMNTTAVKQTNLLMQVEFDLRGGWSGTNYHVFRTDSINGGSLTNATVFWQGAFEACDHVVLLDQPDGNAFYFAVDELLNLDGDGLYDYFEWKFFGDLSQDEAGDFDGDTISNGDEFANGTDPNTIRFAASVPGPRVRTNSLMASLWVFNGVPAQVAVLYDSTNTAGAAWSAWTPGTNWPVALPSAQGRHTVWIGLKGRAADSQAAWQSDSVILDSVPPGVVVDAPTNPAAQASVILVKGHSPEALSKVEWSLGGTHFAPGWVVETGLAAGGDFGASRFEFAVGLVAGTNTLTVRGTDLAGNTSNVVKQIVHTIPTNGPSVSLAWTPGLTPVAGDSFILSGEVSDPGVTVAVSADGITPVVAGVEMGEPAVFFANDVPLLAGTNVYTVTVTDAQGRSVSTNVTVKKSAVALGAEWALTAGYAYRPNAHQTYDVTVGGADFSSVTVNGAGAAWNAGLAQWQAPNVTMNTTGAVPGFVVNANVSGGGMVGAAFNPVIQPQVVFERFWVNEQTEILDYPDAGIHIVAHDCSWDRTNGGAIHSSWYHAEGSSVLADIRLGLLLDTNDIYIPGSGWVTNGTLSWYESFFFPNCFAIPHWDFADYTPTGPTGHGWGDMQGRIQRTLLPGGRRGQPSTTVLMEMSATESVFDEFGGYVTTYPSQEFFSVLWPSNAAASRFKMSGEPMIVESSGSLTGRVVRTFPAFKPVSLAVEVADSKAYTVAVTVAPVTLDIDGDASMDGLIDVTDENGEELTPAGILVPLNTDDDDGDGQPDATDNVINGSTDHDFTDVILRQIHLPGQLTNGIGYWLKLEGDAVVRVFDTNTPGAGMLLGPGTNTEYRLPAAGSGVTVEQLMAHDISLWIEGITTTGAVKLVFEMRDTNGPLGGSGRDVLQLCVPEVRLPAVLGLYKPGTNGVGQFTTNYSSADNAGRIYINSGVATNGAPVWLADQQFVAPVAQVYPAGLKLPSAARIQWSYEDPDDPSDDATTTSAAKLLIDTNGAAANDNLGARAGAVWQEVTGYALSGTTNTALKTNVSVVRFNATDVGGDNFIVKTRLAIPRWGDAAKGAETGIMTMWKRINLERATMASATERDCAQLNTSLAKAFVEVVVNSSSAHSETNGMVQSGGNWFMGLDVPAARTSEESYVKNVSDGGKFMNGELGGWFFLGSVHYESPSDAATPITLVQPSNGIATVLGPRKLLLPIPIATNMVPSTITLWQNTNDYPSGTNYISFTCQLDATDTNRTTLVFEDDFFPYYQAVDSPPLDPIVPKTLFDLGFTTNSTVYVSVDTAGGIFFTGITPLDPVAGKFWGRTLVFTPGDNVTIAHEFVHAIGMAHNCGNGDYTGNNACLMQYDYWWLLNTNGTVNQWHRLSAGVLLCPQHIKAIRLTHLEDETPSRKLGW